MQKLVRKANSGKFVFKNNYWFSKFINQIRNQKILVQGVPKEIFLIKIVDNPLWKMHKLKGERTGDDLESFITRQFYILFICPLLCRVIAKKRFWCQIVHNEQNKSLNIRTFLYFFYLCRFQEAHNNLAVKTKINTDEFTKKKKNSLTKQRNHHHNDVWQQLFN